MKVPSTAPVQRGKPHSVLNSFIACLSLRPVGNFIMVGTNLSFIMPVVSCTIVAAVERPMPYRSDKVEKEGA